MDSRILHSVCYDRSMANLPFNELDGIIAGFYYRLLSDSS